MDLSKEASSVHDIVTVKHKEIANVSAKLVTTRKKAGCEQRELRSYVSWLHLRASISGPVLMILIHLSERHQKPESYGKSSIFQH